jgi:hypothetical protein
LSERTKPAQSKPKDDDAKTGEKKMKPQAARPTAPVVSPRGMSARAH